MTSSRKVVHHYTYQDLPTVWCKSAFFTLISQQLSVLYQLLWKGGDKWPESKQSLSALFLSSVKIAEPVFPDPRRTQTFSWLNRNTKTKLTKDLDINSHRVRGIVPYGHNQAKPHNLLTSMKVAYNSRGEHSKKSVLFTKLSLNARVSS